VREWQRQSARIASYRGCGGLFFGEGIHSWGKQKVSIVRTDTGMTPAHALNVYQSSLLTLPERTGSRIPHGEQAAD